MTAQVAVLNVHGVALASDSAVTVSGAEGQRSYQTADKVFPIAGMPLAVLHSGNAGLWGVPWQLLIEMWSQTRAEVQVESVEGYAKEFADWLVGQERIVTQEAQDDFLRWAFRDYLLAIRAKIRKGLEAHGIALSAGYLDPSDATLVNSVVADFLGILKGRDDFRNMDEVDANAICERLASRLNEDLDWVFDDTPRTPYLDEQALVIAEMLVFKAEPFATDAVLAFAGYGRDDFFPSLYQLTVSGVVGGVMRIYDDSHAIVSAESRVTITPLGITDAMQAFLRGTSPQYRSAAHVVLDAMFEDIETSPQDAASATRLAHQRLDDKFQEIEWEEFLSPMLNIVETLPLSETLRLADSLVGLSSLRQLIQGESSVGGPVDLAKVTKQGGFEWVRSKRGQTSGSFAQ